MDDYFKENGPRPIGSINMKNCNMNLIEAFKNPNLSETEKIEELIKEAKLAEGHFTEKVKQHF